MYIPDETVQKFIDWTVQMTTKHEPELLDIKYDYWFGGLVSGLFVGLLFWMVF